MSAPGRDSDQPRAPGQAALDLVYRVNNRSQSKGFGDLPEIKRSHAGCSVGVGLESQDLRDCGKPFRWEQHNQFLARSRSCAGSPEQLIEYRPVSGTGFQLVWRMRDHAAVQSFDATVQGSLCPV
jgi:hypothetical protein